MAVRRNAIIHYSFVATLIVAAAAVTVRLVTAPAGTPPGDLFVLVSPVFFSIAAKRATRFGTAAVIVSLLGLAFATTALVAVVGSVR